MDRLPHDPKTLRELTEADLRRGARLIIKVQDELDPQLRMATPEGDYHIAMTLSPNAGERRKLFAALSVFMVWRRVSGFTFCSELIEPDCVSCVAVSANERAFCLSRIQRRPRPWTASNFGAVEWLSERSIAPEIVALLPQAPRALTPREVADCNGWFGTAGRFPAVHVPSGELRGL